MYHTHKGGPLMKEHVHALPGSEVIFPQGSYTVRTEGRLPCGNRELLYIEGVMTAGSACCGAIECRIIHVPGLIVSWQHKKDRVSGNLVSLVEPVIDPAIRRDVEQLLLKTFPSSMVILES